MSAVKQVLVPDIGDFKDVPVIEILVKPGDAVSAEDPLVTLESDKATMDIPAPFAGTVKTVEVKVGDKVAEGTLILTLSAEQGGAAAATPAPQPAPAAAPAAAPAGPAVGSAVQKVAVPDIGDFKDVPVIEILVKAGDAVSAEDPLVTLESDKATMDVPAPFAGTVKTVEVKVGDKVSEGFLLLTMETGAAGQPAAAAAQAPAPAAVAAAPASAQAPAPPARAPAPAAPAVDGAGFRKAHASPSVRRYARELGVDIGGVKGSGPKGRILKEDVQGFVKAALAQPRAAAAAGGGVGAGLNLLPWPQVDFAKFGPVESRALSRIKKLSGANLARNWVMIPHVTHHDDADITDLEAFRKQLADEHKKSGLRVTMLAFLIKACVSALKSFPDFNASLDGSGENLVLKNYWHIGFAADTPNGLVVPVLKNADQKGVLAIAAELGDLSGLARDGKLKPADMQGATFTISSLGGIGGTGFTPIINAPEVAILGVCRSSLKPVYLGGQFVPRLMLPLSLSYDHRVIDGASAARFTAHLAKLLADFRRVML